VQVSISISWHVVVNHDVNMVDIDASAENVSGNHDSTLELLESSVACKSKVCSLGLLPFFLVQVSVNCHRREVAVIEQLIKLDCAGNRADEDDHLVKDEAV